MLFNEFDMSPEHHFGRPNPAMPPGFQQFHFMIGEFACEDELWMNGAWKKMQGVWITNYTLNGYAIQDHYRNEMYAGTSLRLYNQQEDHWQVHFFGMPGGHTGVWVGGKIEDRIVLTSEQQAPDGSTVTSRLSFSQITESGFEWLGERITADGTVTPTWRISARRMT